LRFPGLAWTSCSGLLDFANKWVEKGGLVVLGIIVFAESGLLVGFFLPGDSLLFFAGFLSSEAGGNLLPALPWVALVAALAAIIGDQVGYMIGATFGPKVFDRPKSRFFNPEYVVKAEAFFAKHGSKTIVLARFVPIVRTFVPTVAGASHMHYRTFVTYNVDRRRAVGRRHHHAGLLPRRDRSGEEQHRDRGPRHRRGVRAADRGRTPASPACRSPRRRCSHFVTRLTHRRRNHRGAVAVAPTWHT
jgi:membrane protein DedA with SNARE-associated domain